MDKNFFPPLEPDKGLPDVISDIPEKMEPLEDLPLIRELSFEQEPQEEECVPDESSLPEEPTEPLNTEPVIDEIPFEDKIVPESVEIIPEETGLQEAAVLPEETVSEQDSVIPESEEQLPELSINTRNYPP